MAKGRSLRPEMLTDDIAGQLKLYHLEASAQGLSLPEYALRWILQQEGITSVLVGASSVATEAEPSLHGISTYT